MSLARFLGVLAALSPGVAIAQGTLARHCAAFGEVEYRKVDPAVESVVPAEFPAPILERTSVKVGSQPVAATLTLRGRMVFRNRPAVETQFVCLLDIADKPLFFYAIPTLATRTAPTPFGRPVAGGGAALEPPRPRASERPPLPATAVRMRGVVRDLAGKLQLQPCDAAFLPVEDRTPGRELERAVSDLAGGQEGRPVFVEFYGQRESGGAAGMVVLELRRAATETAGCRERFDQREWIVMGGEPRWRLDITARDFVFSGGGEAASQRVPHGGPNRDGALVLYAAIEGAEIRVAIDEQRCVDPVSRSIFAYLVEVRSDGRSFIGCAAHNPALPAP
ncbi:MAG: hypothetical protein FJX02_06230 [Alphaproteobacteria bacterium]|nr:hypothetical protein [Alphaproteobacteria bacterium]